MRLLCSWPTLKAQKNKERKKKNKKETKQKFYEAQGTRTLNLVLTKIGETRATIALDDELVKFCEICEVIQLAQSSNNPL